MKIKNQYNMMDQHLKKYDTKVQHSKKSTRRRFYILKKIQCRRSTN